MERWRVQGKYRSMVDAEHGQRFESPNSTLCQNRNHIAAFIITDGRTYYMERAGAWSWAGIKSKSSVCRSLFICYLCLARC